MEENTVLNEEKEKKEPKTTKQKVFFGLRIAGNVVFYSILVLLFLFAIMNINGGARNQGFPNIFGRGYLNVATDSMSHENLVNDLYARYPEYKDYEIQGINVGDLITSKVLDEDDIQELKVGDVCTFYDKNLNALNTHRIIVIEKDSNGKVSEIIFQGDKSVANYGKYDTLSNEEKLNLFGRNEIQVFDSDSLSNIKGLTISVSAGGGKVLQNLQDNYLFYFVIPVAVLLLVEVFFVIRNIMILRGEKNKAELAGTKEAMLADIEAEKERMRQELLAEMRAQGLVIEDTVKEEPKEEAKVEESTDENKEETVETTEAVEDTNAEVKEETTEEVVEEASNDVEEKKEETEEETTSEE